MPSIKVDGMDDVFARLKTLGGDIEAVQKVAVYNGMAVIRDEVISQIEHLPVENGYIKKAGVLLFHHNPEKWVPGAFIKIAYFSSDADMEYQDEIHGPLISQPDRIIDLLYTKLEDLFLFLLFLEILMYH